MIFSIIYGGISTGYSLGMFAILLRVGILSITLSIINYIYYPEDNTRAIINILTVASITFVSGCFVMGYDLYLTPPKNGTEISIEALISYQSLFLLMVFPILVGYLAGILIAKGENIRAGISLSSVLVCNPILASVISNSIVDNPDMISAYVLAVSVIMLIFSALPLSVMAWEYSNWNSE